MIKFLAILPLLATIACGQSTPSTEAPSGSASASPTSVSIAGFLFNPDSIEVATGDEVTWTNEDEILHTVTAGEPGSVSELFNGETPEAGATFAYVFEEPGTFTYFCARHEHMRGTVIVS